MSETLNGLIVHCETDKQASAIYALLGERMYQDRKWGTIEDRPREVGAYLTLMRQKLSDAEHMYTKSSGDLPALIEIRKVLAVGLACFEQHGAPYRTQP